MTDVHKQPPGPAAIYNPLKMMQFFNRFTSDPLGLIDDWIATYGDAILVDMLGQATILMVHPDAMHEVLVTKARKLQKDIDYADERRGLARYLGSGLLTSDGEFWRKQRKLVAPAFHTQRINEYAETMVYFAQEQMRRWQHDMVVDVAHEMMETTLMIVAKTLFNTDVRDEARRISEAMDIVNEGVWQRSPLPTWIPTPMELKARKAKATLDEIVYGVIEERRKTEEDRGDLLSTLLLAEDDEGARMSDKQVRDEAVTLFLAGHETTANALNWTWMLLAQNPQAAAQLHAELDAVLAGRTPTLGDLPNLPYTEMVIKESMRLYPPAWSVGRLAVEDVEITGFHVPKGTSIALSFYHLHRDSRWWDEPNAFQPERFAEGREHRKYAYLPFGGGARVCIGNSFAMMEAQLLLATFAQRWTFDLQPGQVVTPEPRITLFPRDGLPMRIRQRQPLQQPQPV